MGDSRAHHFGAWSWKDSLACEDKIYQIGEDAMEQQNIHNTTIDGVSYTTHSAGNDVTCEGCAAIEAEEGLCLQLWRTSNCARGKHIWKIAEAEIKASTVYTVHFHHLPSGANLTVECPTLDVAQCVWGALNKSSTITLSTSLPTS